MMAVDFGDRQSKTPRREQDERLLLVARTIYLLGQRPEASKQLRSIASIGTAKLNDRDPEAYLQMVVSDGRHPVNHIGELLPWNLLTDSEESESFCEMSAQKSNGSCPDSECNR